MTDYSRFVVHCKKSKFDVYVGRPSKFGNPFSHKENTLAQYKVNTREEAIERYREWILLPEQERLLKEIKLNLKGKILGCWCFPKDCHAMVLAELSNISDKEECEMTNNDSGEQKIIGPFRDHFQFLSNFYPSEIEHDGIIYPNVEAYYQAQKTLDLSKRKRISELKSPEAAKTAGKGLKIRDNWEKIKISVMREGLRKKFVFGSELAEMLLLTDGYELVEFNYWQDFFWGKDIKTEVGENHLGKLLMEIREELMAHKAKHK